MFFNAFYFRMWDGGLSGEEVEKAWKELHCPTPNKSAGKTTKAPAAAAVTDGAGAVADANDMSALLPQNNARPNEAGG